MRPEPTRRQFVTRALRANLAMALGPRWMRAQADANEPRVDQVLKEPVGIDLHNHVNAPDPGQPASKERIDVDLAEAISRSGFTAVCAAFRLDFNASDPYATFTRGLDAIDRLLARGGMTRTLSVKDLKAAHEKNKPTIVESIEGAHFLEGKLCRVEQVYMRGLRHVQLLHDKGDRVKPLGDISTEPPRLGGLTAFGADVIRECNRLGIVVDLAHASHDTVLGALKVSTWPMAISHTSLDTRTGDNPRMARMMAPRLIASQLLPRLVTGKSKRT